MTCGVFVCALAGVAARIRLIERRRVCCALPALALVTGVGAWGGNDAEITVRLVNSARAADATPAQSEQQAARVLRQAGVEVMWRECSTASCSDDLAPGELWMHVAVWKPAASCEETPGFTFLDGNSETGASVASVYYLMVRQMAESFGLDKAPILGAVMAHEIWRLLGVGHSPSGVMSPTFGRPRIGEMSPGALLFGRDQASRMRFEVLRGTAGLRRLMVCAVGARVSEGESRPFMTVFPAS
jgi:hypothetical protein